MLFRFRHPSTVFTFSPISSASSLTEGHSPITSLKFSIMSWNLVQNVPLFKCDLYPDKMYGRWENSGMAKRTDRSIYAEALGARIKVIRDGTPHTKADMARMLGIPEETYKKYESGERCLPPHLMVEFLRATDFDPWFLLSGEPEGKKPGGNPRPGNVSNIRDIG